MFRSLKIILIFVLMLFAIGCSQISESQIVGQYALQEIYDLKPPPTLILNDDGSCVFRVSYFQGICTTTGTFHMEGSLLILTLSQSDPEGFIGEKYLEGTKNQIHIAPEQYFTILDKDTLRINDDVYAIEQDSIFIRINEELSGLT